MPRGEASDGTDDVREYASWPAIDFEAPALDCFGAGALSVLQSWPARHEFERDGALGALLPIAPPKRVGGVSAFLRHGAGGGLRAPLLRVRGGHFRHVARGGLHSRLAAVHRFCALRFRP